MSEKTKKYKFHGEAYESNNNGDKKLLTSDNVIAGDNIDIIEEGNDIKVSSTLPFSVVNGELCITYEEEEV